MTVQRIGIAFQQVDDVLAAQRRLGLDLTQVNADGPVMLPRPTAVIVDRDRVVRFVDVQAVYTARTEVADTLAALVSLDTQRSTGQAHARPSSPRSRGEQPGGEAAPGRRSARRWSPAG